MTSKMVDIKKLIKWKSERENKLEWKYLINLCYEREHDGMYRDFIELS